MSGGHFNGGGYSYYQVHQFADELEQEIINNSSKNEDGWCNNYSQETLDYLRQKVDDLRKVANEMRHIDYLFSGDHAEGSFLKIVKGDK